MFYTLLLLAGAVATSSVLKQSYKLQSRCTNADFKCSNDKCIPMHARCDGTNDCGDFSDEQNCDQYLCKEPHYFRCKNHRCIAKVLVCDEENDCDDFSDESDCEYFKNQHVALNSTCARGEWQCTDKLCIPEEWVCNIDIDCLDGSDEGIGCTISDRECDGFRCHNKRCIPNEWRCDGHDDCTDNSDEKDCEHHFVPTQCNLDEKKFLCYDGKACIDLKNVCNGKNDCFDRSDEGPSCSNSDLTCSKHGCSHDCVQLPSGPKCLCPPGYHNVTEKTCKDINECEEYGICDQKCKNTPGSYECSCDHKYVLQDDKKTCKAIGGEATMVFSSKTQIRSYLLTSDLLFPVAKNLRQVVGVTTDGHHIYWTDVHSEHESIVKSSEDGSDRELIVTAGLGLPEDIKVDWLTGNLYFTDNEMRHIGVCTNDGTHCTVLVNQDIRKPRAIVLNVDEGTMYWSDWGEPAEIAFANMDGSNARPFLRDDIHWPNGLALDGPNSRLYWTDAKKLTLESIKLDGTDRRVILQEVVKRPFAIAVFENRLFWADWDTHSIDSCDKFTGKNYHTVIKESKDYIYGITIWHSALQQRITNPCALAFCSDICLLNGNGYTCACSEGRELSGDTHTCKHVEKKQRLIVASKNLLYNIEHKSLGKHTVELLPAVVKEAGAVTYDSQNNSLFISDLSNKKIVELNLHSGVSKTLNLPDLGKITSMDYDPTGNNLYLCDSEKATLEVVSLNTMTRKVIVHDAENERPQSVAVVPKDGIMFVSFYDKTGDYAHIDRMSMDGSGRIHIIERGLMGPLSLHFDSHYHRIYFTDGGAGTIEHINIDGDERHIFSNVHGIPVDLTTLKNELFWTTEYSRKLYWADKSSGQNMRKVLLDIPKDVDKILLVSVTPSHQVTSACQSNNGNCSHLCLSAHNTIVCTCPARMILDKDNKTCIHRLDCDPHEFRCYLSNTCVSNIKKCDGHKDCPMGEDEDACKKSIHCPVGYFACDSGECIQENLVCDHHYDCKDKSDEHRCDKKDEFKCPPGHFMCGNGHCISDRFVCDGIADCMDNSDEVDCLKGSCESSYFRCDSGACIPKSWECDRDYDCNDFSDEHAGCESLTCPSSMFTCQNGKCIDKIFHCDGSDDCDDKSDEIGCFLAQESNCNWNEFSCSSNKSLCLTQSAKCNGTAECPQGEDEKDCSLNCDLESFECNNKKCIPKLWTCDGADDCGDKSDESATLCNKNGKVVLPLFSHMPCDDGYRCKSGACISLDLLCNDKHDCYDGSDEGSLCSKSCQAVNSPCSQKCIRTPNGPMCQCNLGYRLMGDGHTCKDVDECQQDPPVCSQICINTVGSYYCDCFDGFNIRTDKKSCKALGLPMSLIYASDNQIREINQKSNSLKVLYSDTTPRITALDVSLKDNIVYFCLEDSATIQRINTLTKKREYIEHIGFPKKIAYDWSTGHVYYYDASPKGKSIRVCSFEQMKCAKLVNIGLHRYVSGLAIDSVNRFIFYSVSSWFVYNSPDYVVYKVNLDGTDVVEVVRTTSGYLTGLTYDANKKLLYYADQHQGKIMRTYYDGSHKVPVFTNLSQVMSLNFFEDSLYYSTNVGEITKCQLYGRQHCDSFQVHSYSHQAFVLAQVELQPHLEDPCMNNTCEYLCVASSSNYKCLCENGKIVGKQEKCPEIAKSSEKEDRPFKFHSVDGKAKTERQSKSSTTITSVLLISIGLILAGLGLMVYAKKKHNKNFSISMKFYNPSYNREGDDNQQILTPGQHEYANPMSDGPLTVREPKIDFNLEKKNRVMDV